MPENIKKSEQAPLSWTFPEYVRHERTRGWYIMAVLVAGAMLAYALLTSNWLFALIIIMVGMVLVINHRSEPATVAIAITADGLKLGAKEYKYSEFSKFWIIYQPPEIKSLYLEFKSGVRPRLTISLEKENPLQVKSFLREYLEEDLEQEAEPFSETMGRIFKI